MTTYFHGQFVEIDTLTLGQLHEVEADLFRLTTDGRNAQRSPQSVASIRDQLAAVSRRITALRAENETA